MNYKKIFTTRRSRVIVLRALRFVPDRVMIPLQYWIKLNRRLNLKNPKRFTEKVQWYKLNYRDPLMKQCINKYSVREYVKSKGLEDILVGLIGRYDTVSDVNWAELPQSFVMKTVNGGGGLNVILCPDKAELSAEAASKKLHIVRGKKSLGGREWAYYDSEPGIVVEELLVNEKNPEYGVNDYKFFCYNGKPKYIYVDVARYVDHKRSLYDTDWNDLHIASDHPCADEEIEKPQNFDEMLRIAAKLSEDFPFVRVDLYNVSGKIYFGELTFYPWSGYVQFTPDEADFMLGEDFELVYKK